MTYKEGFEAIELEPCELVMIRELAVNYRKNLLEKYRVESIRELRGQFETWSEYEDILQYYYIVMCDRLIEKIPEVPQEVLEQGFLAETDNIIVGSKNKKNKGDV